MTVPHLSMANPTQEFAVCDSARTARLLPFPDLVEAIQRAVLEYSAGTITSPERMIVPLRNEGVMLSMPATAEDIAIHKLVNVQPSNAGSSLPTIHGQVTVCDADTGKPLCLLDGPEVTGRRTAAVSMLALRTFLSEPPQQMLIIGTGTQALYHIRAIAALYPNATVWVKGTTDAAAEAFCKANAGIHAGLRACRADAIPDDIQAVITLTTSKQPVYKETPIAGRLVIGVGAFKPDMAEIGKDTLMGSDIYVDDPVGVRHEAGDLIQAGVAWELTRPLAAALELRPDLTRPIVFKSVGTGAWDLAACRVAKAKLLG